MLTWYIIFQTAKESLEWIDNELAKKSAEHCALKAEVKQGLGQGPENSTPPDQLSKSARKRRRKNALKNKESSPLPVGTDGSEKRGPDLAKSRADGTTAELVSDETVTNFILDLSTTSQCVCARSLSGEFSLLLVPPKYMESCTAFFGTSEKLLHI